MQYILVTGWDGEIVVLDTSTEEVIYQLEGHSDRISCVAFNPNEDILATASRDLSIRIWDMQTGSSKWVLEGHKDWVTSMAFDPKGELLVSSSEDRTSRLWDIRSGKGLNTLMGSHGQSEWY